MNPATLLTQLGFTAGETEVYLALLSLNKPSVTDVAKKLEKQRAAIYFHLKGLIKKGIVKESRQGRRLRLVAVSPGDVVMQIEQKALDLKSLVPQLEALKTIEIETPVIAVTESKKGFEDFYRDVSSLPENAMFYVMEGKKAMLSELALNNKDEWDRFFKRMAERKIMTKGIFTEETFGVPQKQLTQETRDILNARVWQVRTISKEILPFQDLIAIHGDRMSFLFPDVSLIVTIKHRRIAQAMVTMFDALFLFAKPVPKPWE